MSRLAGVAAEGRDESLDGRRLRRSTGVCPVMDVRGDNYDFRLLLFLSSSSQLINPSTYVYQNLPYSYYPDS